MRRDKIVVARRVGRVVSASVRDRRLPVPSPLNMHFFKKLKTYSFVTKQIVRKSFPLLMLNINGVFFFKLILIIFVSCIIFITVY